MVKRKEYFSQSYYFDKDELKKEYRRLSKIYHPDKGGSHENFTLLGKVKDKLMGI